MSLIDELLSRLNANASGPVSGGHGLLAWWLHRAQLNRPRSSAYPHCPLGRGDLTGRKNLSDKGLALYLRSRALGCGELRAVDHRSACGKLDGVDVESLTAKGRPGTRAGRTAANVTIDSQGRRAPADSGILDADLRR